MKLFALVLAILFSVVGYHMFDKSILAGIVTGLGTLLILSFVSEP